MRKELAVAMQQPVTFLDDSWPMPPKCTEDIDADEGPGLTDLRKWHIQTLLAINPWGIPSLGFAKAYENTFKRSFDIKDMGFELLADMVNSLPDIFTVQEPDDVTALMFPDYPHDKILHDARYGHDFTTKQTSLLSSTLGTYSKDFKLDPDTLISYAWLNRDEDFPDDAVLAGEEFGELILPMTKANIQGTRGVHQAVMVGAANPNNFYINIRSENMEQIARLSIDVARYFAESELPTDMYSIPEEFIYPGFPCLLYIDEEDSWERCSIVSKADRGDRIIVETVDYGGLRTVSQLNLYLIPRKFFDIPKQAVLVSLIGLEPADGTEKWSKFAGRRMRCFSNIRYYLDCLLLEAKKPDPAKVSEKKSSLGSSSSSSDSVALTKSQKRKKLRKKPQFEVIVCDRNDDEMDIYLDEILLLETYARSDNSRSEEVEELRQHFKKALAGIERPENPLVQ